MEVQLRRSVVEPAEEKYLPRIRSLRTFEEPRDSYWLAVDRECEKRNSLLRRSVSIKSKLDQRESEKLQKRVSELLQQMTAYEKKMLSLREENEVLVKKKLDDSKNAEEKMRMVRRKNVDLSNSVKKLEDQLKQIQQDGAVASASNTRRNSPTLVSSHSPPQQKIKNAESSAAKDKTIQLLQMKVQQLINQLNSMYSEQALEFTKSETHLENLMKISAKERLQLERELASEKKRTDLEDSMKHCQSLEKQVSDLERELGNLQMYLSDKEKLEVETVQKSIAIETLEKKLESHKSKIISLENNLISTRDQNIQLTINNSDLQKQLEYLQNMETEYFSMKENLKEVETEMKVTKEKIRHFETSAAMQVETLKESECRRRSLENEVKTLKKDLKEKECKLDATEEHSQIQKKKIDDLEAASKDLKEKLSAAEGEKDLFVEKNRKLLEELNTLKSNKKVENILMYSPELTSPGGTDQQKEEETSSQDSNKKESESQSNHGSNSGTFSDVVGVADPSEVHVFQALYNYDPQQYSPNEEPNEELLLSAGDFLFVCGGMDEDGFYYGESMDGQKGFIPSNFVRKLSESEKAEFLKIINMDLSDPLIQNDAKALPLAFRSEYNVICENGCTPPSKTPSKHLPPHTGALPDPPVSIHVEVVTNKRSLVVSWLPVTITNNGTSNGVQVAGYSVYVDGKKVKVTNNPTDDQVEIHLDEMETTTLPRYITVRTLAPNNKESLDSVPYFLSYTANSNAIYDTPKKGCNFLNGRVEELRQGSFQSLLRESDFGLVEKSWKNLPYRQSLDFQATQQFQALFRSASVNDAQPLGHESIKFNSHTGLLGDEKLCNEFDYPPKSHDETLCNGTDGDLSSKQNHFPDSRRHVGLQNKENIQSNAYRGRSDNCKKHLRPEDAYKSIVLTDNDVVTSVNIREDIPDVELIDYDDDATESLLDNVGEEEDDDRVRIFMALFSYDPFSMSPNPDAADVELKFTEGQIIKIFGSKDEDGFFVGEAGGKRGLVPCNMVSEVEVDDPQVADELLKESNRQIVQSALGSETLSPSLDEALVQDESNQEIRYMIAIYDYNALELSPNSDVEQELSFKEGDVIEVFGEIDSDGFYYGRMNGKIGLVPSNFITELKNDTLI